MKQIAAFCSEDETLQAHLKAATVTAEDWDSNGAGGHLKFNAPAWAVVVDRDTVDAWTNDADGTPINIILHFVDGRLNWGEWFRVDMKPIECWPPLAVRNPP